MIVAFSSERLTHVTDSGPITISEASVREEAEAIERQASELAERKARFGKLLDYLKAVGRDDWIPAAARQQTANHVQGPTARSGTWTSETLIALKNYPNGAMPQEILDILRDGSLAERVESNPNGLYNAVSTLERKAQLVKHRGRLFLPAHFDKYMKRVEAGEIEDFVGGGAKTILDLLAEYVNSQHGVEAAEIVEHMVSNNLVANAAAVYNNLSKAVLKRRVRKEGKVYLPLKIEAPTGLPEGASQKTPGGESTPGTGEKE